MMHRISKPFGAIRWMQALGQKIAQRWASPALSALMLAVSNGNVLTVNAVLSRHPNVAKRRFKGQSALMRAAQEHQVECLRALLPYSNPQAKDEEGRTALVLAAQRGHTACLRVLLSCGSGPGVMDPDRYGRTALGEAVLHFAGSGLDEDAIGVLLSHAGLEEAGLTQSSWLMSLAICNRAQAVRWMLPFHTSQSVDEVFAEAIREKSWDSVAVILEHYGPEKALHAAKGMTLAVRERVPLALSLIEREAIGQGGEPREAGTQKASKNDQEKTADRESESPQPTRRRATRL